MLRLKDIKKEYELAGTKVPVLKGLNIQFRKNEFVSILGASGSGKTTTLNIIGGLDKYTSGDLIICGKSTKEFKDRDWDIYRNQRIGFIFQSYNLIPHQTVLGNVELALTISGVSKEERVEKAKKALDKVGLTDHYYKKPNQLSGGQCQRVAIARALVNDPEILLADEPTGALDSVTSVQIMELIKEIAKEKLVIMVTHNPELAEKYSTRIVRLSDGQIIEDTDPFSEEDEINEVNALGNLEKKTKAKMSFLTSFMLSTKNLLSKKKRTILICLAGSIGIIGISSVLSVSHGVKNYISDMENDMLSGNPITVSETGYDLSSMMSAMSNSEKKRFIKKDGTVNVDGLIEYAIDKYSSMDDIKISNDITKTYIDYIKQMPEDIQCEVLFGYDLNLNNNIYVDYKAYSDSEAKRTSLTGVLSQFSGVISKTEYEKYNEIISSVGQTYASLEQAPSGSDYILSQYNVLSGKLATEKNEIMIVLDSDESIQDLTLGALGFLTQEQLLNQTYKAVDSPLYDSSIAKTNFEYDELIGQKLYYYSNDSIYTKTSNSYNPFTYNCYNDSDDYFELEVVGILRPKKSVEYGCLERGVYYTEEFTKYAISNSKNTEIVKYLDTNNMDSFVSTDISGVRTGITFDYQYEYEGVAYTETSILGSTDTSSQIMSMMGMGGNGSKYATLSKRNLGGNELPNSISFYPEDFDSKDEVLDYLDLWNSDKDLTINGEIVKATDRNEIKYQDTLSVIISMINSIVNLITIALICFTSLSLVVSCVMIAIITYISVVERIKEIGVIRSLGGRKRDVSNLFNAETIIVGFISGLFGVVVTYILSAIVNLIAPMTIASFPISYAILMILLSMGLTVLSGLIPSRSAAKQDPVKALRTE